MIELVKTVFKAYFTREFIRSRGLVFGLTGMAVWISLFVAPIALFKPPGVPAGLMSAYTFTAILVFSSYSIATWDWAWEVRNLLVTGVLEYLLSSGRSLILIYLGLIPVSLIWLSISLTLVYGILSILTAPPALTVSFPTILAAVAAFTLVLWAHALILGGATLSVGTSGPVMEFISWILPLATGGLTPVSSMPQPLRLLALLTPYSYPAELVRYALLDAEPILPAAYTLLVAILYGSVFLGSAILYFKLQIRKVLKEGVVSVGMY